MSWMENASSRWASWMLDLNVQFLLLFVVAGVIHLLLRRSDPRLRYALWLLVLLRLAVPFVPVSEIGLDAGATVERIAASFESSPAVSDRSPSAAAIGTAESAAPTASEGRTGLLTSRTADLRTGQQPAGSQRSWSVSSTLAVLWLAGAALCLVLLWLRSRAGKRLLQRAESSPSGDFRVTDDPTLSGPAVVGTLRPQIVVPRAALGWKPDELEAALLHEQAHIERRDPLALMLQSIVCAAFFFNPLVWWAARRVRFERELCCDDAVLRAASRNRTPYLRALVRSCEPRRGLRLMPELRAATKRSVLGKRVRRMLAASYRVRTTVPRLRIGLLATALLVACLALGARVNEPDTIKAHPRVSGTSTLYGFVVPEVDGTLHWEKSLPYYSDIELGQRVSGAGLESVEIPESVSGTLRLRIRVSPAGEVLDVQVLESLEPSVDAAFQKLVRGARYAPTQHATLGAVAVIRDATIKVEPAVIAVEAPRPAAGKAVEVLRRLGGSATEPMDLPRVQAQPRFLPVDFHPPFEGQLFDDGFDPGIAGDYSFMLVLDSGGEVVSTSRQGLPQMTLRDHDLYREAERLADRLEVWLGDFRFNADLTRAAIGDADASLVTAIDLRVGRSGVEIVTYLPPTGDHREALDALYRLEPHQAMKLIPAPFLPERLDLFRELDPGAARRHPKGSSNMTLLWKDGGLDDRVYGNCYGSCSLFRDSRGGAGSGGLVLRNLAREFGVRFAIENPAEVSVRVGKGDIIVREGATFEEQLEGFRSELQRLLDRSVHVERTVEAKGAIVMRGRIGEIARDADVHGQRVLHVYRDHKDPDPRSGAGFQWAHDGPTLSKALEAFLDRPVIDETVAGAADESFTVRLHRSAAETALIEQVLEVVEAQTELELMLEQRPVDVVRIVVGDP